jgi:hypothetical protein
MVRQASGQICSPHAEGKGRDGTSTVYSLQEHPPGYFPKDPVSLIGSYLLSSHNLLTAHQIMKASVGLRIVAVRALIIQLLLRNATSELCYFGDKAFTHVTLGDTLDLSNKVSSVWCRIYS